MELELKVLGFLVLLAYWRRDLILYLLTIPGCAMVGFEWYETYPTDTGLVFASTIIGIGAYSLWKVIEILIDKIRGA